MALESQGIQVLRLTSSISQIPTTRMTVTSSVISASAAATWTEYVGSTARYFYLSISTEVLYRIKSMTTNSINIYGTFQTLGATDIRIYAPSYEKIGAVTQVNVPTGQNTVIDITDFDSTARQRLIGVPDEGQMDVAVNYLATNAAQQRIIEDRKNRTQGRYVVMWTDETASDTTHPTWCEFLAYPTGFVVAGKVDDKVTAQITLQIDGEVRWTEKST